MNETDRLYQSPLPENRPFEFNAHVAAVFSDMIKRSVPGYELTLHLMPLLSKRLVHPHGRIYDLGCSLGAGMLATASSLDDQVHLIGVDNSKDMATQCLLNLEEGLQGKTNIKYQVMVQDVMDLEFESADLIIMNFTLQFIDIDQRAELINRIFDALKPGGALLVSEKIRFESEKIDQRMIELHHDFKRSQGYSSLEIMQKRDAIEDVLIPESLSTHHKRLLDAGYMPEDIQVWLQCFNFISILAIRS